MPAIGSPAAAAACPSVVPNAFRLSEALGGALNRLRVMHGRSCAALFAVAGLLAACTSSPPPSTPAPTTPMPGSWRPVASAPVFQQEIAAGAAAGRLFVAGGFIAEGKPGRDAFAYDPSTDAWTRVRPLPVAVHHPAGASWNGRFVVAGGFLADGSASNRAFAFDGRAWSELPRLRRARGAAAAAAVGARLVVAGGVAGGRHVGPVEIFDGTSWRDGAPIPVPRDHISAASDGSFLYAAFGRAGGKHLNTFESYDPEADRWRTLAAVPGGVRSGGGAAFVGGRIVVAGGEAERAYREVHVFDRAGGSWSRLPDMTSARHGFGLVALGATLYALLGGDEPGLAPTRTCESIRLA